MVWENKENKEEVIKKCCDECLCSYESCSCKVAGSVCAYEDD